MDRALRMASCRKSASGFPSNSVKLAPRRAGEKFCKPAVALNKRTSFVSIRRGKFRWHSCDNISRGLVRKAPRSRAATLESSAAGGRRRRYARRRLRLSLYLFNTGRQLSIIRGIPEHRFTATAVRTCARACTTLAHTEGNFLYRVNRFVAQSDGF